jgi:8-oxo-dGTP pyrophosphatase MutT (NUDIX family)
MTSTIEVVPGRRVTVCALILNAQNEILIVKPTYRSDEGWLLPGGAVDQGESPLEACSREVFEELGVLLPIKQLLCVEYQTESQAYQGAGSEGIHFVFNGGVLAESKVHEIRLAVDELSDYQFVGSAEAIKLLCRMLGERVAAALEALEQGQVLYLENQVKVGS